MTGDRRPPLVFDDPFVTLDDDRATRALELLREIVARLPGHLPDDVDRYDDAADAVVALDGPTAVDDGTDDPRPAPAPAGAASA